MSAGTVISGGFPGRVAQEVQPNPKCHGCLHYDGQGGRTGICTIGSKPWMCGDGDAQDIGYAPLARGAGSYLPDMSNHDVQAREVETQFVSDLYGSGSTRPVHFQEVTLGQGHIPLIKSYYERHSNMQKMLCRLHQGNGQSYGMAAPSNFDAQVCSCSEPNARDVAKALVPTLSNRERALLEFSDLVEFVEDVVQAGFKRIEKAIFPAGHHGSFVTSPAGDKTGRQHVHFHPKEGAPVHIATVKDHREARNVVTHHVGRMLEGGAPPKGYEATAPSSHHDPDVGPDKKTGAHRTPIPKKPAITFSGAHRGDTGAHPVSIDHDVSSGVPHHIGKSAARLAKAIAEIEKAGKTPEEQVGRPLPTPPKSSKKTSKQAVASVQKAEEAAIPHASHFKSPHGSYKVESNHSTGEHTVHYKPKGDSSAPSQSVPMKSHEHAVKLAQVHAFVNNHSGEHTHATLHEDHVAVHEPQGGPNGEAAVHKVTSMKQAREHLGY